MLGFVTFLALALQMPSDAGEGPSPSPVEVSWQFKFDFISTPIRVNVGGQTYWYIIYRVTNPGPQPRHFFPLCYVVTEDLKVVATEIGIPPPVFQEIHRRHRNTYRELMSPNQVIGELKGGEDYARESVAIWRNVDLSTNNFAVYVAGLSGETQLVRNPAYDSKAASQPAGSRTGNPVAGDANPKFFTVRKTLEIRYSLPGSTQGQGVVEPVRVETRWVMR